MSAQKRPRRWRTPIAGLLTLLWMIAAIWLFMLAGEQLSGWTLWIQTPFYMIAGIIWIFPLHWLYRWSSKDAGNEISNATAEARYRDQG